MSEFIKKLKEWQVLGGVCVACVSLTVTLLYGADKRFKNRDEATKEHDEINKELDNIEARRQEQIKQLYTSIQQSEQRQEKMLDKQGQLIEILLKKMN